MFPLDDEPSTMADSENSPAAAGRWNLRPRFLYAHARFLFVGSFLGELHLTRRFCRKPVFIHFVLYGRKTLLFVIGEMFVYINL